MGTRTMTLCVLASLALASCGDGDAGFDNGSRADDTAVQPTSPLERALREVKPDMREGVQRTLHCRRDKARREGEPYKVDAAMVRRIAGEYARDRTIAEC